MKDKMKAKIPQSSIIFLHTPYLNRRIDTLLKPEIYILRKAFINQRIAARLRASIPQLINYLRRVFKWEALMILPFIYLISALLSSSLNTPEIFILKASGALLSSSLNTDGGRKKRGVILARVSTDKQAKEGYSLDHQLETLRKLAEEENIEIVQEFVEEGERGHDPSRDAIHEILELARRGEIDYLLVVDIDRVWRSKLDGIAYFILLYNLGVKVKTPKQTYELEDLPSLLLLVIDNHRAEEERKKIGERTLAGRLQKFKEKKWVKGQIDFGYVRDGEWVKRDERYEAVIRDVFELYLKWRCYRTVERILKRKYGIELPPSKIKKILTNPIYAGRPEYGGVAVEDPSLAIVDEETFSRVQKLIGGSKKKKGEHHKKSLELASMLVEVLGYSATAEMIPELRYCCPECKVALMNNGTERVGDRIIPLFKCPVCGRPYRDPMYRHRYEFRNAVFFVCVCGEVENYDCEELKNGWYRYTCRKCGLSYLTTEPPNKYVRYIRHQQRRKGILKDEALIIREGGQKTLEEFQQGCEESEKEEGNSEGKGIHKEAKRQGVLED